MTATARPRATSGVATPIRRGGLLGALAVEHRLVGASLVRIGVALILLAYLLGQWPDRHLIWGPEGAYPAWLFARELRATRTQSLLATPDAVLFDALYVASVVVAIVFLVGWRTRLVAVAVFMAAWSLLRRNPFAMTGGDSLLLLMLPWLALTECGAYLSLDSRWRAIGSDWRPPRRPWRALLHNVGILGMLLQIATMYLFAGLHKLFGAPWLDGSAAGAVLRVDRFALPPISSAMFEHDLLGRAVTLWTLIFELTAPLLLWLPGYRWLVAVQSVLFHGGIGLLMGLVLFAVEAMLFQLILFPDMTYRRLARRLGRAVRGKVRGPESDHSANR